MRPKLITGVILLIVAILVFTLKCGSESDETAPNDNTAPSDPKFVDPNATSPDEQGESGSLIER